MLEHYKSWSHLKKRAESFLCSSLSGRITYFFTNYHEVHNVYGRAAVRLDGRELVCFSWIEQYRRERDISQFHKDNPDTGYEDIKEKLKLGWDVNCTHCESDFIAAVQALFHLSIEEALVSENYIVKILAIMDRRTGKRVLKRIKDSGDFAGYPDWVQTFYKLRFDAEGI